MNEEIPVFSPCSIKQQMILLDDSTDLLLCGGGAGGSKSYSCLMKALKYIQDPAARVMIVRETYPTLKLSGGLVDESKNIYSWFDGEFKSQALMWKFPNGATIQFAAIPDNLGEWQGLAATHILVDEAASFTQEQILFLMSRLRSAKYKGHMNLTMTCNPDRNSFLYAWVLPLLDPLTGIPKPGTENITRYFVNIGGKILWGNSKEELYKEHGHGLIEGKNFMSLSFRFIPLTVYDNPILLKNNPSYLANLLSQPRVNQQRFLHGSWTARPEGSSFFNRDWVEVVEHPPVNPVSVCRSWDLAASVKSETNPDPDYTAGVKLSRDRLGIYYIEDMKKFRKLIDGVLKEIIEASHDDGPDCQVTIPRDPGAGGKAANLYFTRTLAENGVPVKSIVSSGHISKVQNFLPFASLCEGGSVKIVRGDWNDEFLTTLEYFTGSRNVHEDEADAVASAFNTLCKQVTIPTFSVPNLSKPSPIPTI